MTQEVEAVHWQETHSKSFLDYGRYFVPQREEQIAVILDLIPKPAQGALMVELCPGEGLLSQALLNRFENCRVLALDGSAEMRSKTRDTCRAAADRLAVSPFNLADRGWRAFGQWPHAIVSSLAIHHLDPGEKRLLYRDMAETLDDSGVLIIADIVRPPSENGLAVAARQWDAFVRAQAERVDGSLQAFAEFQRLNWNYFHNPDGEPIDKPSSLVEQLGWLREAGLQKVDCAWLVAGHAIFYGYKS